MKKKYHETPDVAMKNPCIVKADQSQLSHNNTYGNLPDFYVDIEFSCRNCGENSTWEAKDQKSYFEVSKRHIDSKPTLCSECRIVREKEKAESRQQRTNRRN